MRNQRRFIRRKQTVLALPFFVNRFFVGEGLSPGQSHQNSGRNAAYWLNSLLAFFMLPRKFFDHKQ
jgi:hypothetical protein